MTVRATVRRFDFESYSYEVVTLALLICVFSGPAWAQNAPKMNYLGQVIDMTELIPPPPPPDSEAHEKDLAEVIEMQRSSKR